ncbi:MAG: FCD domain-containing protein [Proteobacteria bacterium]|nr:FCD domain-containing protein [Pseudomonadota bacterium]MBU1697200.1 FCD domain-containing protein [Pseudomonadota bacterium]
MSVDNTIFKPVKTQRTFEEVSSTIKALIFDGTLQSGDKLPTETVLAKQFNVGRQTVREALRILELSGFIIVKKGFGGGTIIKDSILNKITDLIRDAFQMEKISVDEFILARVAIEKAILNSAIDNADDQDIKALSDNIDKANDLIAKKKVAIDLHFEFHSLLANASKNSVFVIVEGAINAIHRNLRSRTPPDFKFSKTAAQDHEKILDALIKKEREKAINLLEEHIIKLKGVY